MSAASDVLEMQDLCEGIASRLTRTGQAKDRIAAVLDAFRPTKKDKPLITENRALEFLGGKARRVDSWEKDHARAALAELERQERERKDAEHFEWLAAEVGRLRTSGAELRGPHVDALERVLRLAGRDLGALADQAESDRADDNQDSNWR